MYVVLNILVFLLLTGYAVLLMFSKPSYVTLSKAQRVRLTGREKFLLLTLVTGMVSVGGASLGINLSALRLMVWMMMMLGAFLLYRRSPHFNRLTLVYLLFLGWLLITLIWTPSLGYGIRVFLKYLYPLVALLFAATFVHSREFIYVAMRQMLLVSFVLSLLLGGLMTHIVGFWNFYLGDLFWSMSTLNDYLGVMSALSVVMWWRTKERRYLLLIGWFILSATLQSVRTGVLSIGMVLMVASYLHYGLKSLPLLVAGVSIGLSAILFVPQIKEKMFYDASKVESVVDIFVAQEEGNFNTSMRSYMWEHLLVLFYDEREWLGSGLGSVQHYMYENFVFGGLKVTHSDYIQMLCDVGMVGLLLYLLFPVTLYFSVRRDYTVPPITPYQTTIMLSLLSYSAVLPAMGFDNIVNYAFATHAYPFTFIGIMLAYRKST